MVLDSYDLEIDGQQITGDGVNTEIENDKNIDTDAVSDEILGFAATNEQKFWVFMAICFINGATPIGVFEGYLRRRGFGDQQWYFWAWNYLAYVHLAFYALPLVGFVTELAGQDGLVSTVVWYIENLQIPQITGLAGVAEIMLFLAWIFWTDNSVVTKNEILQVQVYYLASAVVTAAVLEEIRDGALIAAKEIQAEYEARQAEEAAQNPD